ncbi:MAG: hypothetical protein GW938_04995 [Leptospira sp.]|nr:hypothetical protein [Leptospira sp.]
MKPQPTQRSAKLHFVELKSQSENLISKENRVLAEISKNYQAGDYAKLLIQSKILEAKITTKLFANESILLEKTDGKNIQWSILQRKILLQMANSESKDEITLPINTNNTRDIHEKGIKETIEQVLTNHEHRELAEDKVIKMLNQLFSFFPWSKNVEMFNWNWENSNAEGYFTSEEFSKAFLLEYNSNSYSKARFLFSFSKNGKSWNLHSQFETSEFYEMFLDKIQNLKKYFTEEGILPQSILVEFNSRSYFQESKGWLA